MLASTVWEGRTSPPVVCGILCCRPGCSAATEAARRLRELQAGAGGPSPGGRGTGVSLGRTPGVAASPATWADFPLTAAAYVRNTGTTNTRRTCTRLANPSLLTGRHTTNNSLPSFQAHKVTVTPVQPLYDFL